MRECLESAGAYSTLLSAAAGWPRVLEEGKMKMTLEEMLRRRLQAELSPQEGGPIELTEAELETLQNTLSVSA
jgi:hypothetical protein